MSNQTSWRWDRGIMHMQMSSNYLYEGTSHGTTTLMVSTLADPQVRQSVP